MVLLVDCGAKIKINGLDCVLAQSSGLMMMLMMLRL
jgi:hypothetical protein